MHWWQFALLGAGGGALVEILAVFKWLAVWQSARRTPTGRVRNRPPALKTYIDLPVHGWMAVFRTVLGAGSATLFGASGQISGAYVAVALGFAAPSILAQLGTIPQVAAAISGHAPGVDTSQLDAATPRRPGSTDAPGPQNAETMEATSER